MSASAAATSATAMASASASGRARATNKHDPEEPAPHLMRGGNRFSDQVMRRNRHDPEKWEPVFGSGHALKNCNRVLLACPCANPLTWRMMHSRISAGRHSCVQHWPL